MISAVAGEGSFFYFFFILQTAYLLCLMMLKFAVDSLF